jgi:shikimate kinase
MTLGTDAPIFLIGYRGTGKTTVARELAARLGCDWIDADDVIEARAGKSIAQIFADDGEGTFRDLEAGAVGALSRPSTSSGPIGKRHKVVALGGGAVLREENRLAICSAGGLVVWLMASTDTILERVAADSATANRRPNLTTGGGRSEVEALLAQRTPLYRECATLIVDTEGKSAAAVADEIVSRL